MPPGKGRRAAMHMLLCAVLLAWAVPLAAQRPPPPVVYPKGFDLPWRIAASDDRVAVADSGFDCLLTRRRSDPGIEWQELCAHRPDPARPATARKRPRPSFFAASLDFDERGRIISIAPQARTVSIFSWEADGRPHLEAQYALPDAVGGRPIGTIHDMAVRHRAVYALDSDHDLVIRCPIRGLGAAAWKIVYDNPEMLEPEGLAVDRAGHIWVADTRNDRILRYVPGVGTKVIGEYGRSVHQLRRPTDVAVDREGRVWIADADNARIVRLFPVGTDYQPQVVTSSPTIIVPESLSVAPNGDVWVADSGAGGFALLLSDRPPAVSLALRDNLLDTGEEPFCTPSLAGLGPCAWSSPDLLVRRHPDVDTKLGWTCSSTPEVCSPESEAPQDHVGSYLYARVTNHSPFGVSGARVQFHTIDGYDAAFSLGREDTRAFAPLVPGAPPGLVPVPYLDPGASVVVGPVGWEPARGDTRLDPVGARWWTLRLGAEILWSGAPRHPATRSADLVSANDAIAAREVTVPNYGRQYDRAELLDVPVRCREDRRAPPVTAAYVARVARTNEWIEEQTYDAHLGSPVSGGYVFGGPLVVADDPVAWATLPSGIEWADALLARLWAQAPGYALDEILAGRLRGIHFGGPCVDRLLKGEVLASPPGWRHRVPGGVASLVVTVGDGGGASLPHAAGHALGLGDGRAEGSGRWDVMGEETGTGALPAWRQLSRGRGFSHVLYLDALAEGASLTLEPKARDAVVWLCPRAVPPDRCPRGLALERPVVDGAQSRATHLTRIARDVSGAWHGEPLGDAAGLLPGDAIEVALGPSLRVAVDAADDHVELRTRSSSEGFDVGFYRARADAPAAWLWNARDASLPDPACFAAPGCYDACVRDPSCLRYGGTLGGGEGAVCAVLWNGGTDASAAGALRLYGRTASLADAADAAELLAEAEVPPLAPAEARVVCLPAHGLEAAALAEEYRMVLDLPGDANPWNDEAIARDGVVELRGAASEELRFPNTGDTSLYVQADADGVTARLDAAGPQVRNLRPGDATALRVAGRPGGAHGEVRIRAWEKHVHGFREVTDFRVRVRDCTLGDTPCGTH